MNLVHTRFVGLGLDGARMTIDVRIGAPVPRLGGRWRCPVSVSPLVPRLESVDGADALQALCLACAAAVEVLREFTAAGGAVLLEDGAACPLETYLPRLPD